MADRSGDHGPWNVGSHSGYGAGSQVELGFCCAWQGEKGQAPAPLGLRSDEVTDRRDQAMTSKTAMYSQAELDRRLLDAANALRGPVDAADFKAYIFPLLFYKRISDTWRWEHDQALKSFDGDEA